MAITVEDFFKFGSRYSRLLAVLFEMDEAVDRVRLQATIQRHVGERAASVETIEEQLVAYGILEAAPYSDAAFELQVEVRDLIAWLLKRQEVATAEVIRGYLGQLAELISELDIALRDEDWADLLGPLGELERTLEKIRAHAQGNFNSIATRVQDLQGARKQMTARERFKVINRIWEKMLVPLRHLIDDRGQIEARFDRLSRILIELTSADMAPEGIRRRASYSRARLARTRRELSQSHQNAVREVEPLYRELRADSQMLEGAARMLKSLRQYGSASLGIEQRFPLEGWRPRGLLSDEHLEARMAALRGYKPQPEAILAAPPPVIENHPISRDEVRRALAQTCPIEDVFAFVLARWPDRRLSELLRVFGWIHRGDFGPIPPVDEGFDEGDSDGEERVYLSGESRIYAWPIRLEGVDI